MNLIRGQYYKIKEEVEIKVADGPLEYCGTEEYKGEVYHNFYDRKWRLLHWIDPDKVEPVEIGVI